jgi:hypothetical protein
MAEMPEINGPKIDKINSKMYLVEGLAYKTKISDTDSPWGSVATIISIISSKESIYPFITLSEAIKSNPRGRFSIE